MRILTALARFETQLEADGRSVHTRGQYRRHIHLLAAWASDNQCEDIEKLEPDDLARFLTSPAVQTCATGKKRAAVSANALRTSLRCFFSYLHKAGLVSSDPARLVRRAICGAPPPRAISPDEVEQLFAVIRAGKGRAAQRDAVLFSFLLHTGVRLSSGIRLDVADIDLADGTARIWTKRNRTQVAYLPASIVAELRAFTAGRDGPVFVGPENERLSTRSAQRRFSEWRVRAGIPMVVSPHSLRHSFASALYAKTADIALVQSALGHSAISSTLVYAKVPGERLREALRA